MSRLEKNFQPVQGVFKRIRLRDLIWNENRKEDFENQQSLKTPLFKKPLVI